jgi:hypothetical protein
MSRSITRLVTAASLALTMTGIGAHTAVGPTTPGQFRLVGRSGPVLRLNWDWVSGGVGAIHYELSYADRTIVLNQYYPGAAQDVSDLDLTPDHGYTLSLRAIDEAGNRSPAALLLFETTPPGPPSNLLQLSTRRITYNDGRHEDYPDVISIAPARDNAGPVRYYEAVLDNQSFGPIATEPGFEDRFSLFRLVSEAYLSIPCGPTALRLRAYDSSLNPGPFSAPLTVVFPESEFCH